MSNPRRPTFIDEINKNNQKDKEPSLLPPTKYLDLEKEKQDAINARNPDRAFLGSRKDGEHDLFPKNPMQPDSDDEFTSSFGLAKKQ